MKRIVIVVFVAGIGLAGGLWMFLQGWGGGGVPKPVAPCTAGVCKVEVSVSFCAITVADSFTVTGENNISWELDNESTESYQFHDVDGVILKTPELPPPDFDLPEAQGNKKKFKLHDKNSKATPGQQIPYPYTIHIQYWVGFWGAGFWAHCRAPDPIIINQG